MPASLTRPARPAVNGESPRVDGTTGSPPRCYVPPMLWLLLACKQPDAAPRDFEAVVHDLWGHYAAADTEALRVDVRDLRDLVDVAALAAAPAEGTLSDLSADEAAAAGAPDVDPSVAVGLFSVGLVGCTPDEMERILFATNQDELYPTNYTAYAREYTSDKSAYDARETAALTWDGTYSVHIPLTGDYTSDILGGVHFVPDDAGADADADADEAAAAAGPYLLSTTVMPVPAVTDPPELVFDVDLQLEVFFPHDDGVVHFFGMWRNIDMPSGFGTDSEIGVTLILGGLHDWDDATTAICDEGRI